MSNIVEVVVADKNLATLMKSFKAVQLETELSKAGPFTVFAPTDLAFGKLGEDKLAELLKPENKVKLTDILNYHVIEGKTHFKDLVNGQKLKTLNGKVLTVHVKDGAVNINGARIEGRDMEASNGVVHSLDKVLLVN
jgi:uncharacterized surface protein with fasciclin (FAS1) repeats